MNELKPTFRHLALYYLLFAISIIPCGNFIPDVFPTRNVSTIYLLTLCVCLIMYYSHRLTRAGGLSVLMKSVSWLLLLLILLRGIKYSVFASVDVLARHTWYFYYVPMLLCPLFLFYISLLASSKKGFHLQKGWYLAAAVTVLFIVLVLTNDLHQLIFRFNAGFADWNNDYSYGLLFYVILVWRYILYISAVIILVIKCRISSSKKSAWVILIPFSIGVILNLHIITGNMPKPLGANIVELPETLIITVAAVLECCVQLGMIPTNTDYGRIFSKLSISAQITDGNGKAVFSSSSAKSLTSEEFSLPDGSRIDDHTVLRKMKIPGGYGFWQDDMTELDRLNGELALAKEELAREGELIRLRGELKEKQEEIEQRTLVYDTIAKRTQGQSELISKLAKAARFSSDPGERDEYRKRITLLGAYIKRYANLTLLSREKNVIEIGELALSVSEVLRYLNFSGIPSEFICDGQCVVSADSALAVFEAFEILLEENYSALCGVFVNLTVQKESVLFKLALENAKEPPSDKTVGALASVKVQSAVDFEDDVAYVCFTMPKGGEEI